MFSAGGKAFTAESAAAGADALRSTEHQLVPAPADEVSFVIDRSAISWPTPLQLNFMTGHSSSWRRHLYYRFVWKKRSGRRLEMLWRYEEWFYPALGWSGLGGMTSVDSNGLLRVEIRPEPVAHEARVAEYLAKGKGWKREQYGLRTAARLRMPAPILSRSFTSKTSPPGIRVEDARSSS